MCRQPTGPPWRSVGDGARRRAPKEWSPIRSVTWHGTYDLVVAGTGAAAFAAAVTAADEGMTVLMLESTDRWGGSTAMSGGGLAAQQPSDATGSGW